MNEMTFHESYGNLPASTLALIKRHNVSPADFDLMLDSFMFQVADVTSPAVAATWDDINDHITANSPNGYYVPRYF